MKQPAPAPRYKACSRGMSGRGGGSKWGGGVVCGQLVRPMHGGNKPFFLGGKGFFWGEAKPQVVGGCGVYMYLKGRGRKDGGGWSKKKGGIIRGRGKRTGLNFAGLWVGMRVGGGGVLRTKQIFYYSSSSSLFSPFLLVLVRFACRVGGGWVLGVGVCFFAIFVLQTGAVGYLLTHAMCEAGGGVGVWMGFLLLFLGGGWHGREREGGRDGEGESRRENARDILSLDGEEGGRGVFFCGCYE